MKDIDEMFKDILTKEEKEKQASSLLDDDNFVLFLIFMLMFPNKDNDKDQPIINIFLGDE